MVLAMVLVIIVLVGVGGIYSFELVIRVSLNKQFALRKSSLLTR